MLIENWKMNTAITSFTVNSCEKLSLAVKKFKYNFWNDNLLVGNNKRELLALIVRQIIQLLNTD